MEATLLTPARVAIIYILFGSLWILFSDSMLHALVADPELESQIQTIKGWLFVLATGALVYWLTKAMQASLKSEIGKRKRIEQELQGALHEAEDANRAKSEFLATMSHEFRTPLNAILGFSDILRAQYFGPLGTKKYEEYVDDIYQSGSIMLALVNDILDIAEIEAGKRPLNLIELELEPVFSVCLKSFAPQASEKNIDLALEPGHEGLRLVADQLCLIQIVSNLLANAIKYTPRGGRVTLSAVRPPGGGTTIRVRDNGVGIPPEKLPTVAEPFSQVLANPHLTRDGKGLGLAIVKSLIDAHQGHLDISSQVGKGTTVTVFIPDLVRQPPAKEGLD